MNTLLLIFHMVVAFVGPIFMIGIINRVKSYWAGRRGPRLYQSWFDLVRLLRKTPVYSQVTSWIFPLAPVVILATTITASLVVPFVPGVSPLKFTGDFVAFLYLLGLGKVFLMLSALDTGSAFEGMGASREATYSALAEPVFMLALATLAIASGSFSLHALIVPETDLATSIFLRLAFAGALFVVLLIESSRVPADDPCTHLELTMVHEVMILDHSGPELAMVQYASAMKMVLISGIIAAIVNPFSVSYFPIAAMLFTLAFMAFLAIAIGFVESLIARLRFRAIPLLTFAAFLTVLLCLLVVNANQGHVQ